MATDNNKITDPEVFDDFDDLDDEIDYNDENAELLVDTFEGCTRHIEYKCPCGKGRIVEERVMGFGDYWAMIKCRRCKKKYEIKTGCGHIWELEEK